MSERREGSGGWEGDGRSGIKVCCCCCCCCHIHLCFQEIRLYERERESKRKREKETPNFKNLSYLTFFFEGTINPSTLIIQKNLFI